MAEGYQLVQLKNGAWSVRALAEGETFHPVVGPVAEAEALYVRQLRQRERAAENPSDEWVIWDVGLGAAANVLTVLRALRDLPRRIRVISFDRSLEPLRFAVAHAAQLSYLEPHAADLAVLLQRRTVAFEDGPHSVLWEVIEGDFPGRLREAAAETWPSPHAIMYDAFSIARNPAMWTLPVLTRLRALAPATRPCSLATYSRSTLLRVTLLCAGWFVGVGHATGEKDETTIAANSLNLIEEPLNRTWLDRARRSTSAEPLTTPEYRQQPLSPESLHVLEQHPQFA